MSYIRKVPNTWWLQRKPYFLFIVRELTSVAVAGYCGFLLYLMYALSKGEDAYSAAIGLTTSPASYTLHTITWFNVTPKVLVFHLGEEKVPAVVIAGAHYAGWLATSALVAWLLLGTGTSV
jgi:fumarate reductase subunit C